MLLTWPPIQSKHLFIPVLYLQGSPLNLVLNTMFLALKNSHSPIVCVLKMKPLSVPGLIFRGFFTVCSNHTSVKSSLPEELTEDTGPFLSTRSHIPGWWVLPRRRGGGLGG